MIAPSLHTKVYLARDATDMRKGFPGLISLTEAVLRGAGLGPSVHVPQPPSGLDEDFILGRDGFLHLGQASGARQLPEATGSRRRRATQSGVNCGPVVDDASRD